MDAAPHGFIVFEPLSGGVLASGIEGVAQPDADASCADLASTLFATCHFAEHSAGTLHCIRAAQDFSYFFLRSEAADGAPIVALAVPDWMRPGCERVAASALQLPPPGAGPSRCRRAGRAALLRAACTAVPSNEWLLVPADSTAEPGTAQAAAGQLARDLFTGPSPPSGEAPSGNGGAKQGSVLARLARWVGAAPGSGNAGGESAPPRQWQALPPALCEGASSVLCLLRRALAAAEGGGGGGAGGVVLWGCGTEGDDVPRDQTPPAANAAPPAADGDGDGDDNGGGDVETVEEPVAADAGPTWPPATQGCILRPTGDDAGVAVLALGEGDGCAVTLLVYSPAASAGTLLGWHMPARLFLVPHTVDLALRAAHMLAVGETGGHGRGSGSSGGGDPSRSSRPT